MSRMNLPSGSAMTRTGPENPLVPAEMGVEIGGRDFDVVQPGKWWCGHGSHPCRAKG
jgi:hypothetical protein